MFNESVSQIATFNRGTYLIIMYCNRKKLENQLYYILENTNFIFFKFIEIDHRPFDKKLYFRLFSNNFSLSYSDSRKIKKY